MPFEDYLSAEKYHRNNKFVYGFLGWGSIWGLLETQKRQVFNYVPKVFVPITGICLYKYYYERKYQNYYKNKRLPF